MGWEPQVWTLPGVGTFERKDSVRKLPFTELDFEDGPTGPGRGSVSIPKSFEDLDSILSTTEGSLIVGVQDGVMPPRWGFYARGMPKTVGEKASQSKQITGPGVGDVFSSAIVYPYDWPGPDSDGISVDPDWEYGSKNPVGSFKNGDMEESSDGFNDNGGAELAEVAPMEPTVGKGSAFFTTPTAPGVDISTIEVNTGTYSFRVTPKKHNSGAHANVRLEKGQRYTVHFDVKEPTGAGIRIVLGIKLDKDGTIHHTNGWRAGGYAWREIGGAAKYAGSTDGTWQTLDLDVTLGAEQASADVAVIYKGTTTTLPFYLDDGVVTGPGIGLIPWRMSLDYNGSKGVTTFEQSSTRANTGTYSAKVVAVSGDGVETDPLHGIVQDVTGLTPGVTYTATTYISHEGGAAERFYLIVRRAGGIGYGNTFVDVPTGTGFTKLQMTFVADTEDAEMQIMYGTVGAGPQTSPTFYVDSALLAKGLPAATVGTITIDQMDDASTDHTGETPPYDRDHLGFIRYDSFSATLDSAGNAWAEEISFRVNRGASFLQFFNQLSALGYEWKVDFNPNYTGFGGAQAEPLRLRVWNPYDVDTYVGGNGTDRSTDDTPAITTKAGLVSGDSSKREASRSYVMVEGAQGVIKQAEDTTAATNFGRRETYVKENDALDADTVQAVADRTIVDRTKALEPATTTIIEWPDQVPYVNWDPGDTIIVNLPETVTKGPRRAVKVTTRVTPAATKYDIDWDGVSYAGGAGTVEAVKRLMLRFDQLEVEPFNEGSLPPIDVGEASNGLPFILVASLDADEWLKDIANYVCDLDNDQVEILEAIDEAVGDSSGGNPEVWLTNGEFLLEFDDTTYELDCQGVKIRGFGKYDGSTGGTYLSVSKPTGVSNYLAAIHSFSSLEHLAINAGPDGSADKYNHLIWLNGGHMDHVKIDGGFDLHGVLVETSGSAYSSDSYIGDDVTIERCITGVVFQNRLGSSPSAAGNGGGRVGDITIWGCTEHGMKVVDGIVAGQWPQFVQVGDVNFVSIGTTTDDTYDCINIAGPVDQWNIGNIMCRPLDNDTNVYRYGLNVSHASATNITYGAVNAVGFGTAPTNITSGAEVTAPVTERYEENTYSTSSTGTGTHKWFPPFASWELEWARLSCSVVQSGGTAVGDVNKNGSTMYATGKPTIPDTDDDSGQTAPPSTQTGTSSDYITADLDSLTTAGDFTLTVRVRET